MTPQKHTGFVAEGISKHFSQIMLCKWLADSNFGSNLFWINYTNIQQLSSFFFSLSSLIPLGKARCGSVGCCGWFYYVWASDNKPTVVLVDVYYTVCWFGRYSYCKKIISFFVKSLLSRITIPHVFELLYLRYDWSEPVQSGMCGVFF